MRTLRRASLEPLSGPHSSGRLVLERRCDACTLWRRIGRRRTDRHPRWLPLLRSSARSGLPLAPFALRAPSSGASPPLRSERKRIRCAARDHEPKQLALWQVDARATARADPSLVIFANDRTAVAVHRPRGTRADRLAFGIAIARIEVRVSLCVSSRAQLPLMLVTAGGARRVECESKLFRNLWLRNEPALWVAIAAQEVAESASTLGQLPAVFGPALRAWEAGALEGGDVAARRVIADHLGERLPLRVFWVQAACEVPAEAAETLLHRVTFGALLFARPAAVVSRPDARRLLRDERLEACPELAEHLTPIGPPLCHRIEVLLHAGREAEVDKRGEVRGQKIAHRFAQTRRAKSVVSVAIHVLALLDALDDRSV